MSNGVRGSENYGRLLNPQEVAEMLDLDKTTIYRHRRDGKFPLPVKIGRSIRWIQAELKKWLEMGAPTLRQWSQMPESKPWQGKVTLCKY